MEAFRPSNHLSFAKTRMANAHLNGTFDGVNFTGADLTAALFGPRGPREEVLITPMMSLIGATFDNAILVQVDFSGNDLRDAHFIGANLSRANVRDGRSMALISPTQSYRRSTSPELLCETPTSKRQRPSNEPVADREVVRLRLREPIAQCPCALRFGVGEEVLVDARALVLLRRVHDRTGRIPPLHVDVGFVAQRCYMVTD